MLVSCLSRGIQMCVSQSVVVHLELEDSVNIRQLELDTIFSTCNKHTHLWWTVCGLKSNGKYANKTNKLPELDPHYFSELASLEIFCILIEISVMLAQAKCRNDHYILLIVYCMCSLVLCCLSHIYGDVDFSAPKCNWSVCL